MLCFVCKDTKKFIVMSLWSMFLLSYFFIFSTFLCIFAGRKGKTL